MKRYWNFVRMTALAALAGLASAVRMAQEQPKSGGTLRYAVSDDPANFDCHGANHFAALDAAGAALLDAAALQARRLSGNRGRSGRELGGRSRPASPIRSSCGPA